MSPNKKAAENRFFSLALAEKVCYNSGEGRRLSRPGRKGDFKQMKIAVPYENGAIFQHFGHSQQFKLYDAADGKVTASRVIGTNGQGHGALAGLLSQEKADVLICGGIGAGVQNALAGSKFQQINFMQDFCEEKLNLGDLLKSLGVGGSSDPEGGGETDDEGGGTDGGAGDTTETPADEGGGTPVLPETGSESE